MFYESEDGAVKVCLNVPSLTSLPEGTRQLLREALRPSGLWLSSESQPHAFSNGASWVPIIEDGLRLIVGSRANNPLALHSSTLERRRQLHPIFVKVGDEEGVPWQLLEGIAATESAFRVDARNPSSGAAGLMQVMPFHFSRLGWTPESGWNDPEENIRAGARILKDSGLGRKPIKETLAAYSGHVTWLRTGKPPYPDKYVDDSLTRALYFWILEIGRMVGVE